MTRFTRRAVLAALPVAGLALSSVSEAAEREALLSLPQWVGTWSAAPQPPVDPLGGGSAQGNFSGQTIRQVIRISAGGSSFRIRLTNEYGASPLLIGAVSVAVSDGAGGTVPGSQRALTFSGNPSLTVPAGSPALSDPFSFPVPGLSSVAVDIYVPPGGNPSAATLHPLGLQTTYVAPGDQTGAVALTGTTLTASRFMLSGMDVLKDRTGVTVVALGDSLTDGAGSTLNAQRRWPDVLAQRLQGSIVLNGVAVSNQGISGGRLMTDGFGPSALSRFDRDVLARPGVRYVIVLIGINDIGLPAVASGSPAVGPVLSADRLAVGYRQIVARARERGVVVIGGTLTPFGGASYYSAAGEATRAAVNAFIRTPGEFDGVIDFDAAVRDPANPARLLPAYDSGDALHLNDAGYERMANAVNLALFQPAGGL